MTGDQLKRFNRWQRNLPESTRYLVDLITAEVVPTFEAQGFRRYADYAGGNALAVGANCIPLQRRAGSAWPTVEVLFDKRYRPAFGVSFAILPETCRRQTETGASDVPRLEANVVEGPAFFSLCKGKGANHDCNFGYYWFAFRPRSRIDREVAILKSLLPWLFNVFESEAVERWYDGQPGYVDRHAFMSKASHRFRQR